MEYFRCIWLATNNKAWSTKEIDLALKSQEVLLVHQNPSSSTSIKTFERPNLFFPIDFINKGKTCYAKVTLQTLCVLPSPWNRVPSKSSSLSPLLNSVTLNMKVKSRSYKPVDPNFYEPSLMYHLILTLTKILLRCYSLSLMN